MDASVEAKVNTLDEELRKTIEDIDRCSKDIGSAMQTHAQKLKEWSETVVEMDKKHSSMSGAYLTALLGKKLVNQFCSPSVFQFCFAKTHPSTNH